MKGNRPGLYADRVPKGGGGPITVHIDKAQIALEAETRREMRWLEDRDDGGRAVEPQASDKDTWAVKQ